VEFPKKCKLVFLASGTREAHFLMQGMLAKSLQQGEQQGSYICKI